MPLKALPDYTEAELKARLDADEAVSKRLQANKKPATIGWTSRQIEILAKEVADLLLDLREAVEELEAKTALLEEQALHYVGTYDREQQYNRGALCTHKSGLWYCQETTRSAPGTSKAWRLTSKTPVAARGSRT